VIHNKRKNTFLDLSILFLNTYFKNGTGLTCALSNKKANITCEKMPDYKRSRDLSVQFTIRYYKGAKGEYRYRLHRENYI
jgi:hypothetical protein